MGENNFEIKVVLDKKVWEKFNLSLEDPSYFQSWDWGEVEKLKGVKVFRYGFYRNSKLEAIFQIFEIKAKRGHFLHIRQGPVILSWDKKTTKCIFDFIKEIAYKINVSYIRISPLLSMDDPIVLYLKDLGFRQSPIHNVDAENRWVLDIKPDKDFLLANMRKTTRYLIKKAQGMDIDITKSNRTEDMDEFLRIYNETALNKKFVPHSLILEEFEIFKKDNSAFVYLAKQDKNILSGALITYYGKEAIYRHGATSIVGRNTPASYLLQWKAINDAKEMGLAKYNFWGIANTDNKKHPWFGLSQFKKGFGGYKVDFIHSMDLPIKLTYWISYLIDYCTKIKKGYNL